MIVFLWRADGPTQGSRGVSDQAWAARQAARERLSTGAASSAKIEEAVLGLGMRTLARGYFPTGLVWQAKVAPGGVVSWIPVTVTAPQGEPGGQRLPETPAQ